MLLISVITMDITWNSRKRGLPIRRSINKVSPLFGSGRFTRVFNIRVPTSPVNRRAVTLPLTANLFDTAFIFYAERQGSPDSAHAQ